MFDNLSDKLQEIIKKVSGNNKLTEENMQEALREVRRALLDADVSLKVVKIFMSELKEKALGEEVLNGVNPSQQLIKIVHDELVNILGKENSPLKLISNPSIIMMLGLQGSGKTTSAAKLALKLKKEGKNPIIVAADIYRPAAVSQLETLAGQIQIPVFKIENSKEVLEIVRNSIDFAKQKGFNVVIIDTAGRLQIDNEMMAELILIDRTFHPDEKLLVIDSMIGQEAVHAAEIFNAQLDITGIILTKLDGDSKGGAALSVVHSSGKPVKLTGTGEKLEALNDFHPSRMADRILGMGDIISLVEKAQEVFDENQAKEFEKKMEKAEFSYNDFLKMQKQMSMFGSIDNILSMLPIPGLNKDTKETIASEGEKQMKRIEAFIASMTPEERANPSLINTSRKRRISKGCGIPIHEVNMIISQFDGMRQMMKGFSDVKQKLKKGKLKIPKNFPRNFGGKFPF